MGRGSFDVLLKRVWRCRRGASAIKVALLLSVAFLVLTGIIESGAMWYTRQAMFSAAREAARSFVLGKSTSIADTASLALDLLKSKKARGTFSADALISDIETGSASISVVVSTPMADAALIGVLPSRVLSGSILSATATMRLETPDVDRPSGWWRYTVSGAGHGPRANQ